MFYDITNGKSKFSEINYYGKNNESNTKRKNERIRE